jgi:hypothetical protein
VIFPSELVSVTISARTLLEKEIRIREQEMINMRVFMMKNVLEEGLYGNKS